MDKTRKSSKCIHPAQNLEGPNTELLKKTCLSPRISSNYHEFTKDLHLAAALKFGAIARIIKFNDWPFQAMPIPPDADGDISQLELDLIMEDYKEE
jgi:hypothetical protein